MNTQQQEILSILREMGSSGMNSFQWRDRFIQLPVRIKELKELGYPIRSQRRKNKSVDYILESSITPREAKDQLVWVFNNHTNTARLVSVQEAQRLAQEGYLA